MQKMLRRTVNVGQEYALHIWTIFLFTLATLLSLFLLAGLLDWDSLPLIAAFIAVWSIAGIAVSLYALAQIRGKAEQIKSDVQRIKMMLNKQYGKIGKLQ